MSLPIVLRPEAETDLVEARGWYDQQRAGLGEAFADAVGEFFTRIEAAPEIYPAVLSNVRRGKLRRFPYVVFYRALADRIEVVAVLHGSRHPHIWKQRA